LSVLTVFGVIEFDSWTELSVGTCLSLSRLLSVTVLVLMLPVERYNLDDV
jgi:hypothetical protein